VKVEVGVGKGKKKFDKRADIAKRDAEREARQGAQDFARGSGNRR
jgi:tmRNA-binding protein